VTNNILVRLYNEFFGDLGDDPLKKKKFWFGIIPPEIIDKVLASLAVFFVQQQIWRYKLRGKLPSYNNIVIEMKMFIYGISKLNKNLITGDNHFSLSRNWHLLSQDVLH
jgi:hypothetical protein